MMGDLIHLTPEIVKDIGDSNRAIKDGEQRKIEVSK